MLHSKFCGKLSTGTRVEDFKGFYHIYWLGSHLVISVEFYFHVPESLHSKFNSKWLSSF